MFTIQLRSKSSRPDVTPDWLDKVAAGIQEQMLDFCADYGLARWTITTQDMPGAYLMTVSDLSNVPGAEGYHDDSGDIPEGFAFMLGSLDEGSVTISHECCELIRDQDAAGFRLAMNGIAYADEACDAVEDKTYLASNGVLLSDYVLPEWYQDGSQGPWDKLGVLTGPLTKTSGGYTIQLVGGKVGTDPPEMAKKVHKADSRSRTARRLMTAEQKETHRRLRMMGGGK